MGLGVGVVLVCRLTVIDRVERTSTASFEWTRLSVFEGSGTCGLRSIDPQRQRGVGGEALSGFEVLLGEAEVVLSSCRVAEQSVGAQGER